MTPTDAAFYTAIAAAPDAALPRLAFADHLDDTARPHHATALRLDAALAAERPWADRYWQLRAEWDQLPALTDWSHDLGWLADRRPLLCGVPADWKSRWRAVRATAARWWQIPVGDAGNWGEAVADAERAVGRELPPGVREWAAFAAEFIAPDGGENFRDPLGFGQVIDGISLLEGAGEFTFWVVRDENCGTDDPPVELYQYPWFGGERPRDEDRYADTTAGFALFYLLLYRAGPPEPPDDRAALRAEFPHAGRFDRAEVFEGPGGAVLLISGDDPAHPAQLRVTL